MIIVDRIINGIAVCEIDGAAIADIPLSSINGNVREGSVIIEAGDKLRYIVDEEETLRRRADITERFNRLKARGKKL